MLVFRKFCTKWMIPGVFIKLSYICYLISQCYFRIYCRHSTEFLTKFYSCLVPQFPTIHSSCDSHFFNLFSTLPSSVQWISYPFWKFIKSFVLLFSLLAKIVASFFQLSYLKIYSSSSCSGKVINCHGIIVCNKIICRNS